MAEYVSFDPNVEVLGRVLFSWIEGTGGDIIPALEAHGIVDVDPDSWYPLQTALAALKTFSQSTNLVNMGKKIIDNAKFPLEQMTSIERAIELIDQAYHMNHRHGEIGHYRAETAGERHIVMVAENPYPSDFDYGLLWSIATRFMPEDADVVVELDLNKPTRLEGANSCTYHITW